MKYLHTMIRVSDPAETLRFFSLLGLREVRRMEPASGSPIFARDWRLFTAMEHRSRWFPGRAWEVSRE